MNLQNNDLKNKLNFALANIEKNNLEKAAEIYKKILKKYPDNFDANFNLGTIFAKKIQILDSRLCAIWVESFPVIW